MHSHSHNHSHSYFYPQIGYYKGYGFAIRCLGQNSEVTTDWEAVALVVHTLRVEVCRVEDLAVRVHSRASICRPVVATRTPIVKVGRVPVIVTATEKRKWFGDNTKIGSGKLPKRQLKDFSNLFISTLSMNVGSKDNADSGLLSEPFGYLRTGDYTYYSGRMNSMGRQGNVWSLLSLNTENARYINFLETNFRVQSTRAKGLGFAIRCLLL